MRNPERAVLLRDNGVPPQPFDAAAAAMDGGLLGASETSYASRATLCVAFTVWCLLQVLPRSLPGLAGIWLSLKGLSVGAARWLQHTA